MYSIQVTSGLSRWEVVKPTEIVTAYETDSHDSSVPNCGIYTHCCPRGPPWVATGMTAKHFWCLQDNKTTPKLYGIRFDRLVRCSRTYRTWVQSFTNMLPVSSSRTQELQYFRANEIENLEVSGRVSSGSSGPVTILLLR